MTVREATQGRFAGRTALVTGAGGGIGAACAAALGGEGAAVALVDLRGDAVQRTAADLEAAGSEPAAVRAFAADVRDSSAVEAVFDRAWDQLGPVDVLVAGAGLYPGEELLQMDEAAWDRVLDTNLKGPFLCSSAFARRLTAAGRPGCVVNISSGAARRARPGAAHYCTSKAGLEMLTRCQALELAPYRIRANAVAPGLVRVDSEVNPLSREYVEAMVAGIPLGRAGDPRDVARAVLFLASDDAEWITGAVLSVDGGSGAGAAQLPLSTPERKETAR